MAANEKVRALMEMSLLDNQPNIEAGPISVEYQIYSEQVFFVLSYFLQDLFSSRYTSPPNHFSLLPLVFFIFSPLEIQTVFLQI